MIQILLAVLAGMLTIGAPCILPLLPILLGASVGQKSKTRPLFIALGFIAMFALTGLTLSYVVQSFMIAPDSLRKIAIFALAVFGIFMIWPLPFELLTRRLSPLISRAQGTAQKAGAGNWGGFVLGLILGLVWTPCAGPVLGSILTLIATEKETARAGILLVAYALGAGIPMLVIAYGGQLVSSKIRILASYTTRVQQIFGGLILLLAVAMYFQYDTLLQQKILEHYNFTSLEETLIPPTKKQPVASDKLNNNSSGSEPSTANQKNSQSQSIVNQLKTMPKIQLDNYGPAPEFTGISHWLNSDPLTIKKLKGKVVLIDFWTYSCINCIRTLPYVTKWYDSYHDKGFVVIGVHTPEFGFEKVTENVATAIQRFKINYPVAQDNDYGTWNAYQNQYWPAEYLIDKNGTIVFTHFGEGNYDHTENIIRQLLGQDEPTDTQNPQTAGEVKSPEMYFGTNRLEYLSADQQPSLSPASYTFPANLKLNTFALEGRWQFSPDKTVLTEGRGQIRLKFSAGKLYMVADSPGKIITVKISVDGKAQTSVLVSASELYTLFDSSDYLEHTVDIEIPEAGFEAFTFTFG
ncbi:MAG: cytochrome c biogenesis protein DipZ [Candidatus Doudnabacteria bacterium]|nr:cytochrome c biogenesis protein DipZ [Candidatus Doudnabacteria bacterium]